MEAAMRVIFWASAMVVCLAAPSSAQTAGAVYAELAGPGHFYSLNAELPVAEDLTVRFGGTLVPAWFVGGIAGINKLLGRGNHNLALGMGLILRKGTDVGGANGSATIGYRYARPGGLFFQVAATPIFDSHRVYPWAGMSIGKAY
jgi:hypothetical protein